MPYDEDVVVEVLQDRADRPVLRLRDRVRHPMQPWSASVHSLLAHLQDVGFAEAPVPYGGNGDWDEVGFMEAARPASAVR